MEKNLNWADHLADGTVEINWIRGEVEKKFELRSFGVVEKLIELRLFGAKWKKKSELRSFSRWCSGKIK